MSALEIVAGLGAVLIGATGTWSPCGFSMIETLGPTGHSGGRRTTAAALASFAPGALVGGIITFCGLAMIGSALFGVGASAGLIAAAAVAVVSALAEARGVRIVPQIRRQLPEGWRRVMPMPLAGALYGVLLGLGFTTFVLTFGVWALAAVCLATGDTTLGLVAGVGFGLGRALPIVVVAPFANRPFGWRATELMAEGALYRRIRLGDATALAALAVALFAQVGSAGAASSVARGADPSASGKALVYQRSSDGHARIRAGAKSKALEGTNPALGGGRIAVTAGNEIRVRGRETRKLVFTRKENGVDAVALDKNRIAYRTRVKGHDALFTRPLNKDGKPGKQRPLARSPRSGQIGRPSVANGRIAYAVANRHVNYLVVRKPGGKRRVVRKSGRYGLSNPTIRGKRMVYVESSLGRDRLRYRSIFGHSRGRVLFHGKRLWTTALSPSYAYVTMLSHSRHPSSRLVRIHR